MKPSDNFNPGQWLIENKLTSQSRLDEVSIGNPIKVNPSKLKVGDKLKVIKEVFRARDPKIDSNQQYPFRFFNTFEEAESEGQNPRRNSYIDVDDIYIVEKIDSTEEIYLKNTSQGGDKIDPPVSLILIKFDVFEKLN